MIKMKKAKNTYYEFVLLKYFIRNILRCAPCNTLKVWPINFLELLFSIALNSFWHIEKKY
jgi:hypothetical protein